MKKTRVASLLLSALSTPVLAVDVYDDGTNSLSVYGRAEGQIGNGDESFSSEGTQGRMTGRLGFLFGRELSVIEDTSVIAKLEWQMRTEKNDTKLNEGKDIEARYTYIGLHNKTWGELILGRTKNPMYQVMRITDKYKNVTPNIYNYGLSSIDTSYAYNRQDSTLQWNSQLGVNEFQAAYVLGNGENDRLDYGLMGSYRSQFKLGDFIIKPAVAISQFNRADKGIADTSRKQHNQTMAGFEVGYKKINFGFTADYVDIKQDHGHDRYFGIDTLISYGFDDLKVLIGYSFLDERDQDIYEKEDWRIEGQWTIARKTYLSLTYDRELAASNKDSDDDGITLGLRYDF